MFLSRAYVSDSYHVDVQEAGEDSTDVTQLSEPSLGLAQPQVPPAAMILCSAGEKADHSHTEHKPPALAYCAKHCQCPMPKLT